MSSGVIDGKFLPTKPVVQISRLPSIAPKVYGYKTEPIIRYSNGGDGNVATRYKSSNSSVF